MKHEKFKVITSLNWEVENPEVKAFLGHAEIVPKSISISHTHNEVPLPFKVITIGYVSDTREHNYSLKQIDLVRADYDLAAVDGINKLQEDIEALALRNNGIICQDVNVLDEHIIVTLLIAS